MKKAARGSGTDTRRNSASFKNAGASLDKTGAQEKAKPLGNAGAQRGFNADGRQKTQNPRRAVASQRGARPDRQDSARPDKNEDSQTAAGGEKKGKPAGRKIRFSVHPLTVILAALSFCMKKGWFFLALLFSAVLHEGGHALVAERRGYELSSLRLLPYGAEIDFGGEEMSGRDELWVALAGPLTSLLLAALTLALFWLIPDLYPYTETAFAVNFSLFLCNLLPVYPLDGGRILHALLRKKSAKSARRITEIVSFSAAFAFCTALALVRPRNFSAYLFFFSILCSLLFQSGEGYRRICYSFRQKRLNRGAPLTLLAFSEEAPLSAAVKKMRPAECYLLVIFRAGSPAYTLSEAAFYSLAERLPLATTFAKAEAFLQQSACIFAPEPAFINAPEKRLGQNPVPDVRASDTDIA